MAQSQLWLALASSACLVLVQAPAQAAPNTGGGGGQGFTEGAACHVVGGPNTGQTGTYDDEGACTGSWGATECHGSNQGKCADGPGRTVSRPPTNRPTQAPTRGRAP